MVWPDNPKDVLELPLSNVGRLDYMATPEDTRRSVVHFVTNNGGYLERLTQGNRESEELLSTLLLQAMNLAASTRERDMRGQPTV